MTTLNNKKGFTLIEIVIVLAIAALVLAGILLAVRGAQENRRDSQRRADLGKLSAQLEASASNNNGVYPVGAFPAGFPGNAVDPESGLAYTWVGNPGGMTGRAIFYATNFQCNGNQPPTAGGGVRQYAAAVRLESGDVFCVTNG